MKFSNIIILFIGIELVFNQLKAQQDAYPFETDHYDFVKDSENRFELFSDSTPYKNFYAQFDSLILFGEGRLNIVHLGGSHIQADIYTHRFRQRLNAFQPGIINQRGFVFPFKIAQTNNPSNYRVLYSGEWSSYKNTQREKDGLLGLSGIAVRTFDTSATVKIFLNRDTLLHFEYNRLKIFHPSDSKEFDLVVNTGSNCIKKLSMNQPGYTFYEFDRYSDSIELRFIRRDSSQVKFDLYGLSFENDEPGIVYNAIGVNGAKLESFLRCELFVDHLSALHPNMVIVSIGTNDGYTRRFDKDKYRTEYKLLLSKINEAAPNAAILLTVPNDDYLFHRYVNRNTEQMEKVIVDLARDQNLGVWDFYDIMGGLNSVHAWYDAGLMNRDRVHFSKPGYIYKGDLMFTAFLNTWESFLK